MEEILRNLNDLKQSSLSTTVSPAAANESSKKGFGKNYYTAHHSFLKSAKRSLEDFGGGSVEKNEKEYPQQVRRSFNNSNMKNTLLD